MKEILILLILIFGVNSSFAKCSMIGMSFFPETKEISLNSMFIIQGYAFSQKTIKSFKENKVYLKSENGELVELNLQEILIGQKKLSQAIFCPATELEPNTKYHLKFSENNENKTDETSIYELDKKESEKVYWITTNNKSVKSLNSDITLEFEKTQITHYGCGPEAYAIFNIKNNPDSEIWYRTELTELETNEKFVYYIKEWKGKLNVGHSMCSGAFAFKKEGKYKVRFTPMNIDGKKSTTTNWITFESPFMNDKGIFGK